ncbi:MAG: helicase-related protein, partial [Vicinamibacteria bacterium]
PRTLSLTVYGDLDLSVLEDLPPGRSPVATLVREESNRPRLYEWMRGEIAKGRQAFVVYPLVEEKEASELRAATAMAKRLAEVFPGCGVGLVHGRMRAEQKAAVMEAFRAGGIAVLVATTVIEVGIDVPNATILVAEHAERFGLSQLHQLRGRVGRGLRKGTCVLMAGSKLTDAARARLAAIEGETSGFRLAEIDLKLRGPGELFGTRQSGLPDLRVGNIVRDQKIMEEARREAFALVGTWSGGPGGSGTRAGSPAPAQGSWGAVNTRELHALLERIRPSWRERFRLAQIG